jgi:hypothetical protein
MGEVWQGLVTFVRFALIYGAIIAVALIYVWPHSHGWAAAVIVAGFWVALFAVALWEEFRPSNLSSRDAVAASHRPALPRSTPFSRSRKQPRF